MPAKRQFLTGIRGTAGQLSVCMIVKNESDVLERCLKSIVDLADEIVVVDTGSTDNTVEIAERCGAHVIKSDWRDDFSYSRNISIRNAHCAWILWLDADDVVPPESVPALNKLKKKAPTKVLGLTVRNERPMNTGSEFVQARIFPNHPGIFFERRIHEQVMLSASRAGLRLVPRAIVIEHHGYASRETTRRKAERNIRLLLQEYDETRPDAILAVEVADSYWLLDETDNALLWYEKVLAIPTCVPQYPIIASQAHLGTGNVLNKRREYEKALPHLKQALELAPDRPDVLFGLAVSLHMSGRAEQAVDVLKKIMTIKEKPIQVGVDFRQARIKGFLRLEHILRELNREDEAWESAEQAVRLAPTRPEIHNTVGAMFFRSGKLVEALHAFEKSVKILALGNLDAHIGLCQVYLKAGRKELADTTLTDMKKMFASRPRFWAFCSMVQGKDGESQIPDKIDREAVRQEEKDIQSLFGLSEETVA